MAFTKCVGPAHPSEDDGEARRDLLGSSSSNTPSLDQLQAPCPADTAGEDDWQYFRRRKAATTRIRLPFPDEFPVCVLLPGRPAYVRVWVERADRQLKRRRRLQFCEGGTA
jgi:hypothetical protein